MNQAHDRCGPNYDFVYDQTFGGFCQLLTTQTVKAIYQIIPAGRILDFAASTGRQFIPLAKLGYKIAAVEKSSGMVNEFNRKISGQPSELKIYPCSISEYTNEKADLAPTLYTALNYSTTDYELSKTIENIANHLMPNGYFFFDFVNGSPLTQSGHCESRKKIYIRGSKKPSMKPSQSPASLSPPTVANSSLLQQLFSVVENGTKLGIYIS